MSSIKEKPAERLFCRLQWLFMFVLARYRN